MNQTEEVKNFIKNIIKYSASSWLNFFISFISVGVCTRLFAPDVMGEINYFVTTSNLLMGLITLGLDSMYIRYYHEPPCGMSNKQLGAKSLYSNLFVFFLLFVITFIILPGKSSLLLIKRIDQKYLLLLLVNTVLLLLMRYLNIYFRMRNKVNSYIIQSALLQVCAKVLIILAFFLDSKAVTAISFSVAGSLVLTIIYLLIYAKDFFPSKVSLSFKGMKDNLLYAFYSWPVPFVIYLNIWLSQRIIIEKLTVYDLGVYSAANVFVAIISVFQGGFGVYWSAFMFENYKKKQDLIIKVHDYLTFFIVAAMAILIISQDLILALLGEKYQACKSFFGLVMVSPLLMMMSETTSYGISLSKSAYWTVIAIVASTIFNIVGCVILIPIWGLQGAAISSLIAGLLQYTIRTVVGQRLYQSIARVSRMVFAVAIIVALAFASWFLTKNGLSLKLVGFVGLLFALFIYRNLFKNILKKRQNNA